MEGNQAVETGLGSHDAEHVAGEIQVREFEAGEFPSPHARQEKCAVVPPPRALPDDDSSLKLERSRATSPAGRISQDLASESLASDVPADVDAPVETSEVDGRRVDEARYFVALLVPSVSGGYIEHAHGEAEEWLSPELYWRAMQGWPLPSRRVFRVNARASFNEVHGRFDAGSSRVTFSQARDRLALGPNWLWLPTSTDSLELNLLYQREFDGE